MTRTGPWVSAAIVAAALVLSGLLIAVTGGSPAAALRALVQGGLGDATAVSQTLLYAAPLLLVAVASEYRYVYWSVLACLLGIAVSLCSRSENRSA